MKSSGLHFINTSTPVEASEVTAAENAGYQREPY